MKSDLCPSNKQELLIYFSIFFFFNPPPRMYFLSTFGEWKERGSGGSQPASQTDRHLCENDTTDCLLQTPRWGLRDSTCNPWVCRLTLLPMNTHQLGHTLLHPALPPTNPFLTNNYFHSFLSSTYPLNSYMLSPVPGIGTQWWQSILSTAGTSH